MDNFKKTLITTSVTSILTAAALTGAGQATAQTENPAGGHVASIEEIVVTARRREESLQSVPITISAFSEETLKEKSINTTQDLQYAVPGVFLSGSGSRSNTLYSIRGQSRPTVGQGSPGVITYFADVPLPTLASSTPQFDIQSIQVLKGPQGTLFGRNTTGGAVLTYPNKPGYEFGGYLEAGLGDYSYNAVEGAVNIPLIDNVLAMRVAGQMQHRDGYTRNVGAGPDLDQLDSKSLRVSFLYEPTDRITNLTVLDYHKNDASMSGALLVKGQKFATPQATFRFDLMAERQHQWGPRKIELNRPTGYENFEHFGFTNRTDIAFDTFEVTNIFGYRIADVFVQSQIDGMGDLLAEVAPNVIIPLPLNVLEGQQRNDINQLTEEFHIKGDLFDGRLDWLVGAFFLDSEPDGVMASATGFFAPTTQTYQFVEEESKALFVNLSYDLSDFTEGLTANLGVRKTWDESSVCSGTGEQPQPGAIMPTTAKITSCNPTVLGNFSDLSYKSNATTWTVGLDWQVNDQLFTYITSRKGYRAGGINGPQFTSPLDAYQTFVPEETVDVEVGIRTDWTLAEMDGRLNIALFHSEASDVQLAGSGFTTVLAAPNCSEPDNTFIDGDCNPDNDPAQGNLTVNVGDTEIEGAEIELTVLATERLTLNASATFQDYKTTSYTVPPLLGPFFPANEIPVLYTPESSYTVAARYSVPMDDSLGELVLNANYYYSDEMAMTGYVADSYDITNLRADWYDLLGYGVDVGFFVRNVFDEEAVVAPAVLTTITPFGTAIYNEPRMWGMEVLYRFGN
ncbi:MAG: TonB-dependent receptor [Desulfobulbaceae bacterium]|jgi:iron complex outermembrane receptor protein